MNTRTRFALVGAATLSIGQPAWASEDQLLPAVLGSIGSFIVDGLGPARTADDIAREERERVARLLENERKAEVAKDTAPPLTAAPADQKAVTPPDIASGRTMVSSITTPAPTARTPEPAKPDAVKLATTKVVAPPPPRPAALVRPAPKPITLPAPPPPEPLASPIAATATLSQALRLGGPPALYGQRIKAPIED